MNYGSRLFIILLCSMQPLLSTQIIIDQPGLYTISYSSSYTPTMANDTVILIQTSNVTLDLTNNSIGDGLNEPGLNGIVVNPYLSNITIQNAIIQNITGIGIYIGDGCSNVTIQNSTINACQEGGILLDGSVDGITSCLIDNCIVTSCTGISNEAAVYGISITNATHIDINNCFVAYNDAQLTTSAFGILCNSCSYIEFTNNECFSNGGISLVAGLALLNCNDCLLTDNIVHNTINHDGALTSTCCGFLFDQAKSILCYNNRSNGNINTGATSFGYLLKNGWQNIFQNCISEFNEGSAISAGFALLNETQTILYECLTTGNQTSVTGTAYGILFADINNYECQVKNTRIEYNNGIQASFGIADAQNPSTNLFLNNYAFNNGTNYSVTYTLGITLPVTSASLSNTTLGLPNNATGILNNIDITP
jgi:hypothetical protein